MRPIVVALGGPSGSGKSTVTSVLARRFGWAALAEAYYRLRPRPSLGFASQGELRALELRLVDEEARRFQESRVRTREGRTVVVDTPFLDPVSYTAGLCVLGLATPASLRAVAGRARALALRGRLGLPDLTVRLSVRAPTRRARVAGDPTRHPRAFRARHEAVGDVETGFLVPLWGPALGGRVRVVPAAGPPEAVAERVVAAAARTVPLRDPCRAAVEALGELVRLAALRPGPAAAGNLKKGTPSPRPPR